MKSNNETEYAVGFFWRRADRSAQRGGWLRDLAISLLVAVAASLLCIIGDAQAKEPHTIQIGGDNRTAMVMVTIGKSRDVRTDNSFVNITVGDPDVADVNPLTDHPRQKDRHHPRVGL